MLFVTECCGRGLKKQYRYIRLTSDRPSQQGWAFSRVPLTATNWEVSLLYLLGSKEWGLMDAD